MPQTIAGYTFWDRFTLRRVLSSVARVHGAVWVSQEALRDSIAGVEAVVQRKPREWVFWYVLSDWYSRVGRLAESVRAAQRCCELRKHDARSPYALASALRTLTHAAHAGDPRWRAAAKTARDVTDPGRLFGDYNPEASRRALQELGMTVDEAAERAMRLFEETRALGLPKEEEKHVRDCLAVMYVEFPHLEQRVRSALPKHRGRRPRDELHFREALVQFQKLRYLTNRPRESKRVLLEIVRLCQVGLTENLKLGDCQVLLANAFLLAAEEVRGDYAAQTYFLQRAGAVIQHWKTRRPPTHNQDAGHQMVDSITSEIAREANLPATDVQPLLEGYRAAFYETAVRPESLPTIKKLLVSA